MICGIATCLNQAIGTGGAFTYWIMDLLVGPLKIVSNTQIKSLTPFHAFLFNFKAILLCLFGVAHYLDISVLPA